MFTAGTEDEIGYSEDDWKTDYDREDKKVLQPYPRCGTAIDGV